MKLLSSGMILTIFLVIPEGEVAENAIKKSCKSSMIETIYINKYILCTIFYLLIIQIKYM